MQGDAIITLFHMNGCGHCVAFAEEWAALERTIATNKTQHGGFSFSTKSYEASELGLLDDKEKSINGEEINGFPTVRIRLARSKAGNIKGAGKNKHHKKEPYVEFMYEGKRQANEIIAVTKSLINKHGANL